MESHVKKGGGNSFSLRNNISSDNTLENEEYISKKWENFLIRRTTVQEILKAEGNETR